MRGVGLCKGVGRRQPQPSAGGLAGRTVQRQQGFRTAMLQAGGAPCHQHAAHCTTTGASVQLMAD